MGVWAWVEAPELLLLVAALQWKARLPGLKAGRAQRVDRECWEAEAGQALVLLRVRRGSFRRDAARVRAVVQAYPIR